MKEKQEDIYYITGDTNEGLDNSPQVEGFKSRDIEVIYLTDMVDNFWTTVVLKYKDKPLKSITKADIDLDNLNPVKPDEENEEFKFDDDKEKEEMKNVSQKDYSNLLNFFKTVLEKNNVKDVKVSKKLTSSPVCLVSDQKGMDIKLERYLLDQKQIVTALPKILEINPNHILINKINDNLDNSEKIEELKEIIQTLYDEACIIEGEQIANPNDFVKRLNKLMSGKF
jgi:molecular chaperone HtpG